MRGTRVAAAKSMPTRLSLRRVGALTGKLAPAPGSLAGLLELATAKLKLASQATKVYTAAGDELDEDDDVLLLREDDVLYFSCGEPFTPPNAAAVTPPPKSPPESQPDAELHATEPRPAAYSA